MASRRTVHTVTELPQSPEAERRFRTITYLVMMGIRVICLVLCIFVRGWWLLLPAAGAIFLPYFAVIVANTAGGMRRSSVSRPGAVVRQDGEEAGQ
ncbi:DUF3099 domain-containing protein [Homoserinibacter sp. GY 40078]|uniref:DUF3099 domain-containing protein n=1 Tax=Homoserinibacter sp. GY 40078 TaxID=2603275 RepID=UPI0011C7AB4A|nr:DUF3099 domain-containing protein [Homoserinibacter sp. GY 40078]TXK17605.1 DUF3099 domain-containing protein [Homoserinibacter sp. GY 40078]